MGKFDLLQEIQNPKKDEKTPLPRGIKYDQHKVIVEGSEILVHVPQRESDEFTRLFNEHKNISKYDFNKILREVRGIRG